MKRCLERLYNGLIKETDIQDMAVDDYIKRSMKYINNVESDKPSKWSYEAEYMNDEGGLYSIEVTINGFEKE